MSTYWWLVNTQICKKIGLQLACKGHHRIMRMVESSLNKAMHMHALACFPPDAGTGMQMYPAC